MTRPPQRTLADKINALAVAAGTEERPLNPREIADGINATNPGESITGQYVWHLMTGRRENPSAKFIGMLARFFRVTPAYFYADDLDVAHLEHVQLLTLLDEPAVRGIAVRCGGLSPASLNQLSALADHLRALETLPPLPKQRPGRRRQAIATSSDEPVA